MVGSLVLKKTSGWTGYFTTSSRVWVFITVNADNLVKLLLCSCGLCFWKSGGNCFWRSVSISKRHADIFGDNNKKIIPTPHPTTTCRKWGWCPSKYRNYVSPFTRQNYKLEKKYTEVVKITLMSYTVKEIYKSRAEFLCSLFCFFISVNVKIKLLSETEKLWHGP